MKHTELPVTDTLTSFGTRYYYMQHTEVQQADPGGGGRLSLGLLGF